MRVSDCPACPWGQAGQSETRVGLDIGYQRLVRVRAGYAFVQDGLSGPRVGLGLESGSRGADPGRALLAGPGVHGRGPAVLFFPHAVLIKSLAPPASLV